ncbi:MAG: DUF4382 domain-containing protein [Gammaproteobacteria bacterium]
MATKGLLRAGLALITAVALFGCGGGSSGSSNPPVGDTPALPAAQTGAVGIILTDAPTAGWDRALGTITSIELLSDEGAISLFEGSETVDFLDLASYSEIFVIAEGVPVGTYDKIRLRLSELELQRLDDTGEVEDTVFAKLVANGKMDLNPRGEFTVVADETLLVELDFDMKKSLKITETGAGDKIIVRPVVFVKIFGEDPFERFTRVHGVVRELTDDGFVLCQTALASSDDDGGQLRHCIDVALADEAGLFDPAADPTGVDAIQPDVELTAIGFLTRREGEMAMMSMEPQDRRIGDVGLLGHVIQIGELGTFSRHDGAATSAVGDDSRFGLDPVSGELAAGLLQLGTQIGNHVAEFVGQDAIQAGVVGVFEGVPDAGEASLLKTSFIVLDLAEPVDVLSGEILAVDTELGELRLQVEEIERCILAADASVFLVTETEEVVTTEQIGLGDLVAGQLAEAFGAGNAAVDGCFDARVIFASEAEAEEEAPADE